MKRASILGLTAGLSLTLGGCLCNSVEDAIKERVAEEVVDRIKKEKKTGKALEALRTVVDTSKTLHEVEAALLTGPTAPVVNWRKLKPFLPDRLGEFSSAGELKGKTVSLGKMKATTVNRPYAAKKGPKLRVEIIDTSMAPMMRVGFATINAYDEDSTEGKKKATRVKDNPAFLQWHKQRSRGNITILVASRFLVKLTLRPCAKPEDLTAAANTIDLAGLAKVKAE